MKINNIYNVDNGASMAFELKSYGFDRQTLAEIITEIKDTFTETFIGQNINVEENSVFDKIITIFADRESAIQELAEDVYYSQTYTGAEAKYFSNNLARASISATAPLTYNVTDGIIGLSTATSGSDGYLSTADWNTFNNKQASISAGTGVSFVDNVVAIGQDIAPTATPTFAKLNGVHLGLGAGALESNTAVGINTLESNTTGEFNTAIGNGALRANTIGYDNASFGSGTLYFNTLGYYNTASGGLALHYNTSGNYNTASGGRALISNTIGNYNTAYGAVTLTNNKTGNNNTAIGYNAGTSTDGISNATAIGSQAMVTASNTIQLGNASITSVSTSGKLTTGSVTYPNIDGVAGQVLSTTGAGTLTWTTPSTSDLNSLTGVLSIAKGGTGTSTQNFVDLTTDQTIAGSKLFSGGSVSLGLINRGADLAKIDFPHNDDPAFISHYSSGNQAKMSFSAGDDATNDYFVFGYGTPGSFVEKLKVYADGSIVAPQDAIINGIRIGKGASAISNNIVVGNAALTSNTTGSGNTAVGDNALHTNNAGADNTALGSATLSLNTTGSANTAVGTGALYSNYDGTGNSAFGAGAMTYNIGGTLNTAMGKNALNKNTGGSSNVAIGAEALNASVAGSKLVAIGYGAMRYANNKITAHESNNNAIGYEALMGSNNPANNTGYGNNAFGSYTLRNNTIGNSNNAFGESALYNNTKGSSNNAFGAYALYNNTEGYTNIAMGNSALFANTTGSLNVAIGEGAMQSNTTGAYNIAIGQATLTRNLTGIYNTAVGRQANFNNTSGSQNSSFGTYALINNTAGSNNIAIGYEALSDNTTGANNTAIGNNTAGGIVTGNNNTIIGANVTGLSDVSNNIIIANGNGAIKARNNGTDWTLTGGVSIGESAPVASAKLEVSSTTQGFLPPRMTKAQRDLISSPASGLTIYNTDSKGFEIFNGTNWYSTVHYVGESYGGGTVFYVYDNGQHGLIASNSAQSTGAYWRAGTDVRTMALADGIGAGKQNTAIIIASQGYGNGDLYAARICNEYSVEENGVTYGDWYLPSKKELLLMCAQKSYLPDFVNNNYWSSTEVDAANATYVNFQPSVYNITKNNWYYVRAIRSF